MLGSIVLHGLLRSSFEQWYQPTSECFPNWNQAFGVFGALSAESVGPRIVSPSYILLVTRTGTPFGETSMVPQPVGKISEGFLCVCSWV